jgi:hypothetical protein
VWVAAPAEAKGLHVSRSRRILTLAVVCLSLAACGGLSSSEATRLVSATEDFGKLPTESFNADAQVRGSHAVTGALRDLGLIEVRREWIAAGFASGNEDRAHLTTAGRTRMAPWKWMYNIYNVPFATKRRIVSVRVSNLTSATAEAEVRWVFELTDIGEQLAKHDYQWGGDKLDAEHTFTAAFKKYDDGWHFESFKAGTL